MPDNDKIEPCPNCKSSMIRDRAEDGNRYTCVNITGCKLNIFIYDEPEESLDIWNEICKLVRLGELVEKFIDYPPWDDERIHTPMFKKIDEESFKHWYSLARSDGVQACINMLTLPVEVPDRGE